MRKTLYLLRTYLASQKQPKYDQNHQDRLTPRRVMAETPEQLTALHEEL
jgi:hypothetical protein